MNTREMGNISYKAAKNNYFSLSRSLDAGEQNILVSH